MKPSVFRWPLHVIDDDEVAWRAHLFQCQAVSRFYFVENRRREAMKTRTRWKPCGSSLHDLLTQLSGIPFWGIVGIEVTCQSCFVHEWVVQIPSDQRWN